MAYIDNSETKKELNSAINGNSVSNFAPSSVANQVIPVINVNPKDYQDLNTIRTLNSTGTGSVTIYTTPTDRDAYLWGANLSIMKDVACDMATGNLILTIVDSDGASRSALQIPVITLTAQSETKGLFPMRPIKLARGTNLSLTGTFTAGVCVRSCELFLHVSPISS